MSQHSQMTTALLTEHFRQTPLPILDEIINTVNELVYKAIDRLEEALAAAPADVLGFELPDAGDLDDEAYEDALAERKQKEIEIGIVQLESLLNAIVDKNFDKVEIYTLRNIFAVGHEEDSDLAQWICLDHYKDLNTAGARVTPEEVQLQRRKRHETAKLNIMLKEEQAKNAAVIEQLSSLVGTASPLGFLTSAQPPQTAERLRALVDRLPEIKQYLSELRLSQASATADPGLAKRRRYLETQSLKVLEHHGLTVEKHDQVMLDKPVGRDDVEGLEAVVQALGDAEGAANG